MPKEVSTSDIALKRARTRFQINLLLFVLVALSAMLWFKRHMEYYLTEGLLIGGTLSLWGAWQVVTSALTFGAEDELKSLPGRLLNGVNSANFLSFCLLLTVCLHAFTSSIHCEYLPSSRAANEYAISALYQSNGQPFMDDLKISSARRIAGKPFFFRFRTEPLVFEIQRPRGFFRTNMAFGFATRIHLNVPDDFEPKRFHVLRIVPSPGLVGLLSERGGVVQSYYDLEVAFCGVTNVISDFRKETAYVGADRRDLEHVHSRETVDQRRREFNQYMASLGASASERAPFIDAWERTPRFFPTADLSSNDVVHIALRQGEDKRLLVQTNLVMEGNNEITTIYLTEGE